MKNKVKSSRRRFLKTFTQGAMIAGVSPSLIIPDNEYKSKKMIFHASDNSNISKNDNIQIALIGAGIQGNSDTHTALKIPGVKLIAVSDLYSGRLVRSKELYGNDIFTTKDYKEILNRKDIDAVIVAVPDHLHSQIGVDVMKAGKALYCEKPIVQKISQGHEMIDAERETKQVVQIGSQRVSSIVYAKARELYKSGAIGELNFVEAYYDRQSAQGAWQYTIPPDATPQTVDWDRFISDKAPKIPFDPIRFFRWRNYQDYGTGVAGDLFVHLFSGIHFILDSKGPNRVVTSGGLRYWKDGRDVPDIMVGIYDYPKTNNHPEFNLTLRVNFEDGSGGGQQFRFVGSEGQMLLKGNSVSVKKKKMSSAPGYTIGTFPEAMQEQILKEYRNKYPERFEVIGPNEEEYYAPKGYDQNYDHFNNFFNAMRNNIKVVEDSVFGFRAAAPALLSNMSYFEKKIINWDPESMKIV